MAEARNLSRTFPVFWISFGSPVRELTGSAAEVAEEFEIVDRSELVEWNSLWLLSSSEGSRAVVFNHRH
jgi:hypothetical protein